MAPGPRRRAGSTTVDQLTLMLGRVLRENAQLMERNNSLSDAAQLWANVVRAYAQTREPGVGQWSPQRLVAAPAGTGHSRGGYDARATAPRTPRTALTDRSKTGTPSYRWCEARCSACHCSLIQPRSRPRTCADRRSRIDEPHGHDRAEETNK